MANLSLGKCPNPKPNCGTCLLLVQLSEDATSECRSLCTFQSASSHAASWDSSSILHGKYLQTVRQGRCLNHTSSNDLPNVFLTNSQPSPAIPHQNHISQCLKWVLVNPALKTFPMLPFTLLCGPKMHQILFSLMPNFETQAKKRKRAGP